MTPFRGQLKIRHLEIILAVTDAGSLSRAAQRLHATQSALSRGLAEVEDILGGRLFVRTGKGLVTTPLGVAMSRHCHVLLADLRKAEIELAAVARGEQGSLTIGCFSLFSGWPLTDMARRFRARHPNIALSITTSMHEDLVSDLDSGRLDVLVSRAPPALDPGIYRIDAVVCDPPRLVCAPGHPLAGTSASLADCAAFPWITTLPGSRIQRALEAALEHAGVAAPTMIGALSLEFGRDAIRDARHLWMLPGCVAAVMDARDEARVLPVDLGVKPAPLATIWRRDRPVTRQMREFADTLPTVVAETRFG